MKSNSDEAWELFSNQLTNVRDLRLSAGFNEGLNDDIPLHWPLERLVIDSSCGELVQTPWITEGLVKHLVLWLTSGLRFDGPTNQELYRRNTEAINSGEKQKNVIEGQNGKEIELTYLPDLVAEDRQKRWSNMSEIELTEEDSINVALETVEILENDAMDQFMGMFMGCREVRRLRNNVCL